jgi:hypothetical protein
MDKFIKCHHGFVMRRAKGLGSVYKKPEHKPEPKPEPELETKLEPKPEDDEKALVKFTGSLRTSRLGRTGRGGRGGGSIGRAEGSSFRGWK